MDEKATCKPKRCFQVAEVASPIVSSTSHPETEASPNQTMMVQVRASNCIPKQTDNIGSIITMLIDDQVMPHTTSKTVW